MSNQASTPPPAPGPVGLTGVPAPTEGRPPVRPITQARPDFRKNWPTWMKQLPMLRFPPPNPAFQLIKPEELDVLLADCDPEAVKTIKDDLQFLEHELMRLFRERDYEASLQQNRYRLYQIGYIVLSTLATLVGTVQSLALNGQARWVPLLAFIETVIALAATLLASISGREPPFPLWLTNRRRAESLRREYFRYLMHLPPYDQLDRQEHFRRQYALSGRAADINRGSFPDEAAGN